ncbi:HIT domain-containing protein [Candidatus Sumerlaeota bacterium]|nr:HIT domain-containing protein [Candidatus Sumerlaeota bacterium]
MKINGNLFVPSKIAYVRGDKPAVECILCAIIIKDPRVKSLEVFRSAHFSLCANLYPYSPGHLLIFPKRHVEDVRELTLAESRELFHLEKRTLDILDKLYHPHGYNIGYNIGEWSGNSIKHLHLHIVPRYRNELGFVDIITETRIIVDDPVKNLPRLRKLFKAKTF